jgi:hypothetical protein
VGLDARLTPLKSNYFYSQLSKLSNEYSRECVYLFLDSNRDVGMWMLGGGVNPMQLFGGSLKSLFSWYEMISQF